MAKNKVMTSDVIKLECDNINTKAMMEKKSASILISFIKKIEYQKIMSQLINSKTVIVLAFDSVIFE